MSTYQQTFRDYIYKVLTSVQPGCPMSPSELANIAAGYFELLQSEPGLTIMDYLIRAKDNLTLNLRGVVSLQLNTNFNLEQVHQYDLAKDYVGLANVLCR